MGRSRKKEHPYFLVIVIIVIIAIAAISLTGGNLLAGQQFAPRALLSETRPVACTDATQAQFDSPARLASDASGRVFISDASNHVIRVWENGKVTTLAGTPGVAGDQDGPLATARFNKPQGLAIDSSGAVFVADTNNHKVKKIQGGQVTTVAGTSQGFADGPIGIAQFDRPEGVAVDSLGDVYVADTHNHRIRKVSGGQVTTFAGSGSSQYAKFDPATAAGLPFPRAVEIDGDGAGSYDEEILYATIQHYVIDIKKDLDPTSPHFNKEVMSPVAGKASPGYGDGATSIATFNTPQQLTLLGDDLYVADTGNHRIRKVPFFGPVTTVAGSGLDPTSGNPLSGSGDGPVIGCTSSVIQPPTCTGQLKTPQGVVFDSQGNLFIADTGNHELRKVSGNEFLSTSAGSLSPGFKDCEQGQVHAECIATGLPDPPYDHQLCEGVPGIGVQACSDNNDCTCGNGMCESHEDPVNCPLDCPDVCGDGLCTGSESPLTCSPDCPDVCGDGLCTGSETSLTCTDCFCGDGVCDASEDGTTCPNDCLSNPLISYHDSTLGDLKAVFCGDGTCSTDNVITTLDSFGIVGQYSSVAIGSDGNPVISYYDISGLDLKVAKCTSLDCSASTIVTVDSVGNIGSHTSIAIGSDLLPVISYYDILNGDLKVAKCTSLDCSSSTIVTVDPGAATSNGTDNVGVYTSIAMGSDGMPVVSYLDVTNSDLKVAKCTSLDCSASTLSVLDNIGFAGSDTSIAIGNDGFPVISYYRATGANLVVAKCTNLDCSSRITNEVDILGSVGQFSSIAIGSDGMPVISYRAGPSLFDLKVAKCTVSDCSSSIITTLDSSGAVGEYTSINIGSDNLPVISYYDRTNGDLKMAKCTTGDCSSFMLTTVDSVGDVGRFTSIT